MILNQLFESATTAKLQKQHVAEGDIDEGLGSKLAGLGVAGAMALGSAGANARVTPDGQGGFTGGLKPAPTVTAPTDNKPSAEAPSGFSKEYLQKAADPNRTGRYMISVEKAQELLKGMQEAVTEAGPYGSRNPDTMSPGDYDRYQQDQMDYGKRDFKRREHEAEWEQEKAYSAKLAAQQAGPWYIRLNGKVIKDKQGNPYTYNSKAAANKAAVTMQAKLFNQGKEFMLTTNPNDKPQGVAEGSNVDSQIKRIKDRILQLKDWNTAGTHDKKIKELQARLKELQQQKQGVAEGSDNITAVFSGYGNYMNGRGANVFKHYGITILDKQYNEDEDIAEYTVSGSKAALDQARAYLERSDQFGGMILKQGVAEGAEQVTPNWAKYVLDQIYNSNGAVTMTDLFDEGIPGLRDMFMATAKELGADPNEDFMDVESAVLEKLEGLIKGGHDLEEGMAEGSEDRRRFIRHNIWTAMDSDEEVLQHTVEGDPFYSAKKFMRDLDDQGYDFTHVISPEGEITYSPQHDPRHLKNFPDQGVAEGSALDNYRQRVNSQGFTDSPEERDADRAGRKRRHQDALNRISDIGGGSSDEERAHQAQQRMARDEYKLDRLKRNDDDWENTFDMMRDRMNRYQWSSQRDVDPEQLAAISNIKYEPRQKNEAVQAKTDDKLLAYYAQRKAEKQKQQGVAEGSQQVDSLVTDALKLMRGSEVRDAVRALTTVLGNREYNSRRGHYNFYVRQMLDMYGQQGVAESQIPTKPDLWDRAKMVAESKFGGSNKHAMIFAAKWYQQHGGVWKS